MPKAKTKKRATKDKLLVRARELLKRRARIRGSKSETEQEQIFSQARMTGFRIGLESSNARKAKEPKVQSRVKRQKRPKKQKGPKRAPLRKN